MRSFVQWAIQIMALHGLIICFLGAVIIINVLFKHIDYKVIMELPVCQIGDNNGDTFKRLMRIIAYLEGECVPV